MKMYDCDACQSAGSVNQWGVCEICGESSTAVLLTRWQQLPAVKRPGGQLPVAPGATEAAGKNLVVIG